MIFKFIKKTSTENYQFMKFIFIGGINTLFGYGVYLFFLFFGLNFAIAALVSTILGIIFNFFTTGRFVFNSKNNSLFFRFILVYVLIYFFTVIGLSILYSNGISYEFGGAILILPNAFLSFFLNKKFVFNNRK
ncbi:MAG: GtrA family protein [Pelagibacteraceae bacterium]|jgi:putative flippase GtrA|nr:GtrA family protein [Pelagibacteraceae bacterium]